MKSPKHLSFLDITIVKGLVLRPIHILYSLAGFLSQNLAALHVYHPQLLKISGEYVYRVSQSIVTYDWNKK